MRPTAVTLRKNLARALRQGHPWVFRDALDRPPALPDGAAVEVRTRDGRPVAVGFWDARSAIAVRVLGADADVDRRLAEALRRRLDRLDLRRTTAFRWVHGEADRLPGIHGDLYDDTAVIRYDGAGARAFYRDLPLGEMRKLREVVDRETHLRQGFGGQGGSAADLVVRENGLLFEVSPGRGGKGGLFLDQRENREEVERRASGRTVLNLFGYTGGFALYAARGGATSTDTVDTARPALVAARRNFERNGLPPGGLHAADAFDFLAASRGRRWDLVVSDPPSFAPSRAARAAGLRAYARLHRLAAAVVAPGGLLCAASCSSHVGRDEFLATLEAGARAAGRRFVLETVRGAGLDHPSLAAFPEGDYLKFAIGTVK